MEKGEVEGRGTNPYADYMAAKPQYLREKLIVPLVQAGLEKETALPDVPLLADLDVAASDRPLVEFMTQSSTVGRPLATTPGVPPERVAALRKAFDDMLKDPAFIADAKRVGADIRPMEGDRLADLIRRMIGAPEDVRQRMKVAIEPKSSDTVK